MQNVCVITTCLFKHFTDTYQIIERRGGYGSLRVIRKIERIVGKVWVRTDDLTRYSYGYDVITYFSKGAVYPENHPLAVVYPGSTREVQAVVTIAENCGFRLKSAGRLGGLYKGANVDLLFTKV